MRASSLQLFAVMLAPACALGTSTPLDDGAEPSGRRPSMMPAEGSSDAWTLPADVRAAGEAQVGEYVAAGPWDGGSHCAGGLLPGTRALGDYLRGRFGATLTYEGYACQASTADGTRMSMQGSGRAFAIAVPLAGGDANNALGDPIANLLVEHAAELGVQFIVWDGTKWNVSYTGRKDQPYTGSDPHHDRLYVELDPEAGAAPTAFIGGGMPTDPPPSDPPPTDPPPSDPPPTEPPPAEEICADFCFYAFDGVCDDGGPGAEYDDCEYGFDCFDCGPRM
jgi:hypothetical protein